MSSTVRAGTGSGLPLMNCPVHAPDDKVEECGQNLHVHRTQLKAGQGRRRWPQRDLVAEEHKLK